jgi:hypothetical protein
MAITLENINKYFEAREPNIKIRSDGDKYVVLWRGESVHAEQTLDLACEKAFLVYALT